MKQKVVKPALLLMIAALLCYIPLHGYYPFAVGWFAALCTVRYLSPLAYLVMLFSFRQSAGILTIMKYGIFMGSLGICLSRYRSYTKKYNYLVAAVVTLAFGIGLEGMDWAMSGSIRQELYFLIPIILIEWSVTAIFTYLVQKFMWYIPAKTSYFLEMKRQQTIRTEEMLRASYAFKNLAAKIRGMTIIENNMPKLHDNLVEQEINNNLCFGCENGQIQYMERMKLNYLWYNKMLETREAMAIQLGEMADIMEYYTRLPTGEKRRLWGMENYIRKRLRERKMQTKKIAIMQSPKNRVEIRVSAKKRGKNDIPTEVLERTLSEAVARPIRVSGNSLRELTDSFEEYVFYEDVNFSTVSGTARRTRQDEDVSGDNFTYMEMDCGQTFMSICDGMGSGEKARDYSEMIIDLLEQLLSSGFGEDTTLKLINSVMLTGNQWQEPATLDMALIDRYSGICQFLKMGAACTYIKRGNWVECIKSTSLPMGVMENVDMETITKKLYDGDFVIMISDGIVDALQCEDKEEYMGRIIMDIETLNPKEMALQILNRSLEMTEGIPRDDMTVICTGIWDRLD